MEGNPRSRPEADPPGTATPAAAPALGALVLELLPRLLVAGGPRPPRGALPSGLTAGGESAPGGAGGACPPFPSAAPTPLQLRAALHLARTGGMSVGALATALGLSISRASHIADELERDGMLTRERDPRDRRVVRLAPSEWATAMGRRLLEHQAEAVTRALERTPADERPGAVRFLERLVEEFERRAAAPPTGAGPGGHSRRQGYEQAGARGSPPESVQGPCP